MTIYSTKSPEWETNDNIKHINGIYFHGVLQSYFDYDVCGTDDIDALETGILNVKVDGYDGECIAYIWRLPGQQKIGRGVIVDKLDSEAIEYAKHHYENKSMFF